MADLSQSIGNAVKLALDPQSNPDQRAQAYTYLDQVKANCLNTYQSCFLVFLAPQDYEPPARLFALQVVDQALEISPSTLDPAALEHLRQGFVDYIQRSFVDGDAEGTANYLRNKIAQTLFQLFLHLYGTTWPDFFSYFISLSTVHPSTSTSADTAANFNPQTTDLLLRILHEISTELSDVGLRLNKPYARLTRDGAMRDAVRAKDAPQIANAVFAVLTNALTGLTQASRSSFTGKVAADIVELAVRVVGDYVGWVDINLIITPQTLPMLFQCLALPQLSIRMAVTEAFIETVSKGMPPADKLQLVAALDLSTMMQRLLEAADVKRKADPDDEEEEHFREKLAKLTNTAIAELCKICDEPATSEAERQQARDMAFALSQTATVFLADEYDDTAVTVIPGLASVLSIFKKEKKRDQHNHLTPDKTTFMSELLQVVMRKMKYDDSSEWIGTASTDSDDVDAFLEFRKNLKILFDAVGAISEEVFSSVAEKFAVAILDDIDSGSSSIPWQQAELALAIVHGFGEAIKSGNNGPVSYVLISANQKAKAKKEERQLDLRSYPVGPLGHLLLRMIQSRIASFPHPSVPLQYFECIIRYHEFFAIWPETIPPVLAAFIDERGLHQPTKATQLRCFYLFQRFVFYTKTELAKHLNDENITALMDALLPLLQIKAELVAPDSPDVDPLLHSVRSTKYFDSQLSLFDAVGTLAYVYNNRPERQTAILQAVLVPLLEGVRSTRPGRMSTVQDLIPLLQLHHYFLAIASVSKGFPVLNAKSNLASGAWVDLLVATTPVLLDALRPVKGILVIREAGLAAFKVLSAAVGTAILPSVSTFIETVVGQLTSTELTEFLNFLGLLINKYKADFAPLFDALISDVFQRIFASLQQPIQGTDDQLQHSELCRAYFHLINSAFAANFQSVFLSERNKPNLETMLNSIVHFCTTNAKPLDQKSGFAVLIRILCTWMASIQPTNGTVASQDPIPGLEQFFYSSVTPICFSIPRQAAFDYGDAQSYTALGEIASCVKAICDRRGQEYVNLLATSILPQAGANNQQVQDFCSALMSTTDSKQFRKVFAPFMQTLKQQAPIQ